MSKHTKNTIQPLERVNRHAGKPTKTAILWLLLLFFATLYSPGTALSANLLLGAASGERLNFEVRWLGIPAGEATLKIDTFQRDQYTIQASLSTSGVVRLLHPLQDIMEAKGWVSASHFQAQHYQKDQRKRDKRKRTTYQFEKDKKQVLRVQKETGRQNDEVQTIKLNSTRTTDPLSSFYTLRAWPKLLPNAVLRWSVVDGDKLYDMTIAVGGNYQLQTVLGEFVAFPVRITVKNSKRFLVDGTDGKRRGEIVVWLTNDRRRIPIKIEAEMSFGNLVAELVSFEDGAGGGAGGKRRQKKGRGMGGVAGKQEYSYGYDGEDDE